MKFDILIYRSFSLFIFIILNTFLQWKLTVFFKILCRIELTVFFKILCRIERNFHPKTGCISSMTVFDTVRRTMHTVYLTAADQHQDCRSYYHESFRKITNCNISGNYEGNGVDGISALLRCYLVVFIVIRWLYESPTYSKLPVPTLTTNFFVEIKSN